MPTILGLFQCLVVQVLNQDIGNLGSLISSTIDPVWVPLPPFSISEMAVILLFSAYIVKSGLEHLFFNSFVFHSTQWKLNEPLGISIIQTIADKNKQQELTGKRRWNKERPGLQ